jgi:hypothetical protein
MLWAQSQLVGHEYCRADPKFTQRLSALLGHKITEDSHALEYIGLGYSWNHVNCDDPMLLQIHDAMEKYSFGLDNTAVRNLIKELLRSTSANSSFWRFELKSALYALNFGKVTDLFEPASTRRQGDPLQLLHWKVMALQHVHFHLGKGQKKYRALHLVSDALGQSTETLRSWEKIILQDDDLEVLLGSTRLAGQLESEIDNLPLPKLIELHAAGYHRHTSDVEYAKHALAAIRSNPLKIVRDGLRSGRTAK